MAKRSLWSRFRRRSAASLIGPLARLGIGRVAGGTSSGEFVTTRAALSLSTIYRCVALISDLIADAPRRVVRLDATTGARTVDTTSPAAAALADLAFEDFELLSWGFLADGNGFAWLHRDESGRALWIEGLPSWAVGVDELPDGRLRYRYSTPGGQVIPLPTDDVLHARFRCIGRRALGESPLETCRESIGLALSHRSFASYFMRYGAGTLAVLKSARTISEDAARRLQEQWNENQGASRRRAAVVLEQGMDLSQLDTGTNARDAQLVEVQAQMARELSRIYGVPLGWLGFQAERGATAAEETRALVVGIRPTINRVSEALSRLLFSREQRLDGWRVELDTARLVLGYGDEAAEYGSKLVNAGLATPNEARRQLGLGPIADGDTLRAPVNTAPVDRWRAGEVGGATPAQRERAVALEAELVEAKRERLALAAELGATRQRLEERALLEQGAEA